MTISASNIGASESVVFRRVTGARFPAWVWRELHTTRTSAGDDRSGILVVEDGAEEIMMMTRLDYEMLITRIREEGDQP